MAQGLHLLNTIIFKYVYWYMKQISGERLQDHWSSGLSFFSQFELSHFFGHFSERIEGTLCAQLLLQFYTDTFETLQTL